MKMWTDPAMTPTQWLDYARNSFEQLYREGEVGNLKMVSLDLRLRIIGHLGGICALEEFLRHVRSKDDVWIASRRQIAQHFASFEPA